MTHVRYLHGYSPAEQRRLHRQARTFAPILHRDLRFPQPTHLLEVGCGAGAQTALLLQNNPHLRITAVDYSPDHLAAAQRYFARRPTLTRHRLTLCHADATKLPFKPNTFDAALSVWLLEHTPDPLAILREVRRVLRPTGRLHLREVFNASVYIHPRCPAMEDYWAAYNALQTDLAGNPNIGPHLGNLLHRAGFRKIHITPEPIWLDRRTPAFRRHWLAYWHELLLSAAPNLLAHKRIPPRLLPQMKKEVATLQSTPNSIFFFSPIFDYAEK